MERILTLGFSVTLFLFHVGRSISYNRRSTTCCVNLVIKRPPTGIVCRLPPAAIDARIVPIVAMSTLPVSLLPVSRPQPQFPQRKLIKKGGYTRQRRGCLTCRQRKKKCDQGLPICGHCSRLNLVCKHEKPREVVSSVCGEDAARDSGGAEAHQRCDYDNPSSPPQGDNVSEVLRVSKIFEPLDFVRPKDSVDHLSSSRRTMMRYYTSTLAIMLSATAENNCFLSG